MLRCAPAPSCQSGRAQRVAPSLSRAQLLSALGRPQRVSRDGQNMCHVASTGHTYRACELPTELHRAGL